MQARPFPLTLLLSGLCLATATAPSGADEGVIEINQAAALAGGITVLDGPGFPVSINSPGTYKLTGSLTVVEGTAIEIRTSAVTLDLNDQVIDCNSVFGSCAATPGAGIDGTFPLATRDVTVRNGTVRFFPLGGVVLGTESHVKNVFAEGNGEAGISVGDRSVVEGSTALSNTIGIKAGERSIVRRTNATGNTGNGIEAGLGSRVSDCRSSGNEGDGVNLQNGGTVQSCQVGENQGYGIRILNNASVSDSSAVGNTLDGIRVGLYSAVHGNTASFNGLNGIVLEGGSTVSGNATGQNGHDGISQNAASGQIPLGSTIIGNSATNNGGAVASGRGIDCPGPCLVRQNTVQGNDVGLGLAADSTYSHNVISNNGQSVVSGVNLGDNYCAGTGTTLPSCP